VRLRQLEEPDEATCGLCSFCFDLCIGGMKMLCFRTWIFYGRLLDRRFFYDENRSNRCHRFLESPIQLRNRTVFIEHFEGPRFFHGVDLIIFEINREPYDSSLRALLFDDPRRRDAVLSYIMFCWGTDRYYLVKEFYRNAESSCFSHGTRARADFWPVWGLRIDAC
jgi:hypothetical protein